MLRGCGFGLYRAARRSSMRAVLMGNSYMADPPENLVLELLRGMRSEVGEIKSRLSEMATKSDVNSLREDLASDLLTSQKDTRDQIVGLRRAVVEYHSAVIGHGMIISDLEARVRRVWNST
jgi:hypothetical protein